MLVAFSFISVFSFIRLFRRYNCKSIYFDDLFLPFQMTTVQAVNILTNNTFFFVHKFLFVFECFFTLLLFYHSRPFSTLFVTDLFVCLFFFLLYFIHYSNNTIWFYLFIYFDMLTLYFNQYFDLLIHFFWYNFVSPSVIYVFCFSLFIYIYLYIW